MARFQPPSAGQRNIPNPFQDTATLNRAFSLSEPQPDATQSRSDRTIKLTDSIPARSNENKLGGSGKQQAASRSSSSHGQEADQENPLVYLSEEQRKAAIENLDIETMDRIQTLRAALNAFTNSLRFRSEAELNRLPPAVRNMTVEEFWFTYNGSAKEYLERQATKKAADSTSFLNMMERAIKQPARFKPYPDPPNGQQRKTTKPFVNPHLGQDISKG
ncbi:MAG: hypothetical protein J3Q66DRAFT_45624 [Benniella sp.]|nr:MAG: hypothetical protein J3Q66DRAFT_45624 [Benniella sp.]